MQLLERETQLQLLDDALREVNSGVGRIALIYGEAGIGKTSLVEHFLRQHGDSHRILRGACDALFTPRPLGPLHDIALQTGGSLLALFRAEAPRFEIFTACLLEFTARPTLVVVEDLHWADEATLDWLKYLGRRIRQTTSLVILTYRDDEIGASHPLRQLLGDLGSSGAIRRIPISSLSKDAVRELAQDRKVDAAELHRLTNGNPFYVTEVLATEGGIPETVRDAVLARAARLSPSARAALEAAAVIGLRVEPWLLSPLAGTDSETAEECVAAGMLQPHANLYAFRHELARQTILGSIAPHRKAELHRRALEALQARPETQEDAARLADHAAGAEDAALVLQYAPTAARQASDLGAHRQAAALFRTALDYSGGWSAQQRAQLLDDYADECEVTDHPTEADRAQQEALQLWREAGQLEKEGRALRRLAEIALRSDQTAAGQRYTSEAIATLEQAGPSKELARAYSHLSRICMIEYHVPEAMDWGTRAMEMAEELGDELTLMHALNNIGTVDMWHNRKKEGWQKLERSLRLARTGNNDEPAGRAYYNLTDGLLVDYDFDSSLTLLAEGLDFCTQHDLDNYRMGLWSLQARIHAERGHWLEAEQVLRGAPDIRGDALLDTRLQLVQLKLYVRRGDPIAAADPESLRARSEVSAFDELRYPVACVFAELAWLQGDLERCRLEAEPLFRRACELGVPRYMGELSYWMWRAGAISAAPPGAAEPYASQIAGDWRAAAAMWQEYGCPYEQGMALMDGDEAAQREALQIFEGLGAKPIAEKLKQQLRAQGVRGIPRGPRPSTRTNAYGLTARELEVLAWLVKGSSNSAIAKQLSLSTRTVEHHIASMLQKTGTQSRSEAVALALRENLVSPG